MSKNIRRALSIAMAALLITGACSAAMFLSAASETDPTTAEEEAYTAQACDPQPEPATERQAPVSEPVEPAIEQQAPASDPPAESAPAQQAPASDPPAESAPAQQQAPASDPADLAPEEPAVYGSVSGYLWVDGDKSRSNDWNGRWDSGEPALSGYTVNLYRAEDIASYYTLPNSQRVFANLPAPCAQTRTDAYGAYVFDGLKSGYYVAAVYMDKVYGQDYLPPLNLTSDNKFTLDNSCDAPYIAFSDSMDLRCGQNYKDVNAGMRLPEYAAPTQSSENSADQPNDATGEAAVESASITVQPLIATVQYGLPVSVDTMQDESNDSLDDFEDDEDDEDLEDTEIFEETDIADFMPVTSFQEIMSMQNGIPASFKLSMNIAGENPDRSKQFMMNIHVRDLSGAPQYGMTFQYAFTALPDSPASLYQSSGTIYTGSSTGIASVLLRHGDTMTFTFPSSDYQIKIAQSNTTGDYNTSFTDPSGMNVSYGETEFLDLGTLGLLNNFTFTNTLASSGGLRNSLTNDVTISKRIAGAGTLNNNQLDKIFYFQVSLREGGLPAPDGTRLDFTFSSLPGSGSSTYPAIGQTNFQNGMATIILKHGHDLTLKVPTSYEIRVMEVNLHQYQSYTPSFTDSAGAGNGYNDTNYRAVGTNPRTFTFTNTRGPGVTITKTITNANPNINWPFNFSIYLKDQNGANVQDGTAIEYSINTLPGSASHPYETGLSITFQNGKAQIFLRHGYSFTIYLREGYQFSIEEEDQLSYTTYHTDSYVGGNINSRNTGNVIMGNTARTFVFYNTRGPGVTLVKTIPGNTPDIEKPFTFQIILLNQSGGYVPEGAYIDYSFESEPGSFPSQYVTGASINFGEYGLATIIMRHGYKLTLYMRTDFTVQIREITDPNYIASFTDSHGASGSADTGPRLVGSAARTFTFTNTHNRAGITVSKTVTGIMADKTKPFTFTLYVSTTQYGGIPITGTVVTTGGVIAGTPAVPPAGGTITLSANGTYNFTLYHGQTLTFDLQGNWGFRVVETLDPYYTTTFTDSSSSSGQYDSHDTGVRPVGTVAKTIAFLNTSTLVPTGIGDSNGSAWAFMATAGLAIISALTFTFVKKRRGRGEQYRSA